MNTPFPGNTSQDSKHTPSNAKLKTAQAIRVLTVPPVLVSAMLLLLYHYTTQIFRNGLDLIASLFFLGLLPILAYPLQPLFPKFRKMEREGQRALAFLFSLAGYFLGFFSGLITQAKSGLQLIYTTYLLSVVFLSIWNKLLHLRASGHACSITGPLIFLCYFLGLRLLLPCACIMSASFWASLTMKRHTPRDLFWGTLLCIAAFLCAMLIFHFL